MAWIVRAETKHGSYITLRSGFKTEDEALDHPIIAAHWRRVWVEEYTRPENRAAPPPPRSSIEQRTGKPDPGN